MKQKSKKTVEIPIKGEIVPDKKLGNRVKFNFPWRSRKLNVEDLPEIYEELQKPFPKEAIQTGETRDGRKLVGIKEQFITNRFNEVLGLDKWSYDYKITTEQYGKVWMSICDMRLMIGNWKYYEDVVTEEKSPDNPEQSSVISTPRGRNEFIWLAVHENVGGCFNMSKYDSRKGAISNAFKKCAAKFGVGREAYEGMMVDEDMLSENGVEPISHHKTPPSVKSETSAEDPLPINEGTPTQQKGFNELLTELNNIDDSESLSKVEEVISQNINNLTPKQQEDIKSMLKIFKDKYEQ